MLADLANIAIPIFLEVICVCSFPGFLGSRFILSLSEVSGFALQITTAAKFPYELAVTCCDFSANAHNMRSPLNFETLK